MPEQQIPVSPDFKGVNKRVAPHMLPPGFSQDCTNCRPYNGQLGRLGPRKGRTKTSLTPYGSAIIGLHCSDDYMFVSLDDGSSVTIVPESLLYPSETGGTGGGSAYSGPTVTSINNGFYARWQGFSVDPDNPAETPEIPCNIPINGATKAIATCPSSTIEFLDVDESADIYIYLKFDSVAWALANRISIDFTAGCCGCAGGYSVVVSETPTPIDITGRTALRGIKAVAETLDGESCTLSGDIYVMGTAATLENI